MTHGDIDDSTRCSRRDMLRRTALGGVYLLGATKIVSADAVDEPTDRGARIAITLDLEMARNFPRWEDTEWDYQKGNLTPEAKRYAVDVCQRVKERGGVVHCFAVGQVFEQADVGWLKKIADTGHPIGNHTYDHVYLLARDIPTLQYRFARAPWLARGRAVPDLIRENIALTNEALQTRVGVKAAGFRTPGGFAEGLNGREDLQQMLLDLGFTWVSSKYPAHAGIVDLHTSGGKPSAEALAAMIEAQSQAQPFVYPTGLVEVPMSPISDIVAFRGGRWKLDDFLAAIRSAVAWAIEREATFDFLAHPSCLGVVDPEFKTVDMICDMVADAGPRAKIVSLDVLAERATKKS